MAEGFVAEAPSLPSAIDKAFKLTYIANMSYTEKADHIWQYLQKGVCCIFDESNTPACVHDLQLNIQRLSK